MSEQERKQLLINGQVWLEIQDAKHGRPYYHCKKTGETTWIRPKEISNPRLDRMAVPGCPPRPVSMMIPPPIAPADPLPEGWKEMIEPTTQRKYYVNVATRQTQWNRPRPRSNLSAGKSAVRSHSVIAPAPAVVRGQPRMSPNQSPMLPDSIAAEIHQFKMDDFASRYFTRRRKGFIFKRQVPLEDLMRYQNFVLPKPLLQVPSHLSKDAINCFKLILGYMGEKAGLKGESEMLARRVMETGVQNVPLRDEIFVQLVKQTTENPAGESCTKAWMLMALCSSCFPPTKDLEEYLRSHLLRAAHGVAHLPANNIPRLAKLALNRFSHVIISGEKPKLPSAADINGVLTLALSPYVFGASLADCALAPDKDIPMVLAVLCDLVIASNGMTTQGVFRVPGDEDELQALRRELDSGNYDLTTQETPHTPASALKLWLRELSEPIIPHAMYRQCIDISESAADVLRTIGTLPQQNRLALEYLTMYLQSFAEKEVVKQTSMTLENLAMVCISYLQALTIPGICSMHF